jgi:hypothetical protein
VDYIFHFIIGLAGAGAGLYARTFCKHRWHQVAVGASLIGVEAVVSVQLVG